MTVEALQPTVTATEGDPEVQLSCEMIEFTRPDEEQTWFRGNELITDTSAISFRNGTPNAAQNGGTTLTFGRVSTLTITDPTLSDSGLYTCILEEARAAAQILLEVTRPVIIGMLHHLHFPVMS